MTNASLGMRPSVALIIEDEADIRQLVEEVLRQAGFEVLSAASGAEGIELAKSHSPEIITLDISMPGMDGIETAKRLRAFSNAYLIMLTARSDEIDVLQGLDSGADDYLTKPFRPRELRARIEAMLRRPRAGAGEIASVGESAAGGEVAADWREHRGLRVNLNEYRAQLDGTDLDLTRSEFEILAKLVSEPNRVHSKFELVEAINGVDYHVHFIGEHNKRAIEVHMANLRKKLGDSVSAPRFIETVRGVGYRLTSSSSSSSSS